MGDFVVNFEGATVNQNSCDPLFHGYVTWHQLLFEAIVPEHASRGTNLVLPVSLSNSPRREPCGDRRPCSTTPCDAVPRLLFSCHRAAAQPAAVDAATAYVRIVVFLTDGYVGNDMEIISEIQKHPNARVFAYGVGSSVNHFLLDKMAEAERVTVEYASYKQEDKDAEAVGRRLYERLRAPRRHLRRAATDTAQARAACFSSTN
jgi:hypothetical protein